MQQCPYCHSPHVQLLRQSQQSQSKTKFTFSSCSPMSLATVGMQISKRLGINPFVGGFIGLAAGGMFLLYIQEQDNLITLHYQCEQCQEHFEIQHTE
ncbi:MULTISPECIES: hypothetical protein [Acinetobacter]|uniref:hypothetical protein n=1 Tax=Acinetobacter TaxID=469 RepID=UPI00141B6D7F|nr:MULTISPECIES: hypothetical protein [Acinetobacter]MCS4297128.1 uncharacterized protein YbaR (Trm112 family) [Acinetobacter guillouiae]MCW2250191.1 uncharacterized protein YbaR (Trm112 family) [Acinetobacter sp. BIGb0204]NII39294.1 uncharacterized protein YbaR (Trm112 family) [Acinetobacter sp. BIGb0196]